MILYFGICNFYEANTSENISTLERVRVRPTIYSRQTCRGQLRGGLAAAPIHHRWIRPRYGLYACECGHRRVVVTATWRRRGSNADDTGGVSDGCGRNIGKGEATP